MYGECTSLLLGRVYEPRGFFARARGLIARAELDFQEGMLFKRCNSVHMCFMSRSIDIVFVGKDFVITSVVSEALPFRFYRDPDASHTLECRSGASFFHNIKVGHQLTLEEF